DSQSLVYSMQGSLWLQSVGSNRARQLTSGPGYDYQPDVSPDGRTVVFARYHGNALELHSLDLASGKVRALTSDGNVNLEPRFAPDGKRLAWVSTRTNGRFHVYIGSFTEQGLESAPMLPERASRTPRYYYGEFDHELSPSWSSDGKSLLYVSNPEVIYGSGAIWRRDIESGETVPVRLEETTWRAQPDWSPDGKRVIYSSYLGRQWHQLWLTTAAGGGDPVPLSYGDYDVTAARWSPDGERIAYIANEGGDLEIRVQEVTGGAVATLAIDERDWLQPRGTVLVRTLGADGKPVAARVMVSAADGRRYAPDDAWLHADDGFDRQAARFEPQYFHSDGVASVSLPVGEARIVVWRGLEHRIARRTIDIKKNGMRQIDIQLEPLDLPAEWQQQISADVHVHMNYGGHYRNTPPRLVQQAAAEDLDVVFNLVVNKEQRIPDIHAFSTTPDTASTTATLLLHGQEFHTSYWGHLGLLGLDEHFLLPGYTTYANTGLASPFPDNATVGKLAHAQNALVGYVHPYLSIPDPASESLSNALPVDAALGTADYYEVVGFADHRTSAEVWYRLLNCGMPLAAAGGTDAMANYASLRGPVGINRTYAEISGNPATPEERRAGWLAALRAGRTIATNGPLLNLSVDGHAPGENISVPAGGGELSFNGYLRSLVPIDHLELVQNGEVIRRFQISENGMSADIEGSVSVQDDGWLLLRAWNDEPSPDVFDLYPYATTNAVFTDVADRALACGSNADYFIAWLDDLRDNTTEHPDYNTEQERRTVLEHIAAARAIFLERR
ncbi:MAG: CehA/McbA family metallohydrolase, partial [Woeseia sp.]